MSPTREAITLARDNGGFITTHEAEAVGLSRSGLRRRVDDGVFIRIRRGMYALPGVATRPDLDLRIACRLLGAVVSHQSAAAIHSLVPAVPECPTVTVSHRSTHKLADVTVHQSTDLHESHVTMLDGLSVTTPVRTIVDLAKVLSASRLERTLDKALSTSKVDLDELVDLFAALARKGKPGVTKLRKLLESRERGSFISESELEFRFLKLIGDAGLPRPEAQFKAGWLRHANGRVDFAYHEQRIVVECDGRRWHSHFDAFETDRRRDNAAQLAGWRVLRFTWRMLQDEPHEVVSTVRRALDS